MIYLGLEHLRLEWERRALTMAERLGLDPERVLEKYRKERG